MQEEEEKYEVVIPGTAMVVAREKKVDKTNELLMQSRKLEFFTKIVTDLGVFMCGDLVDVKSVFSDGEAKRCVLVAITRGSTKETLAIVAFFDGITHIYL